MSARSVKLRVRLEGNGANLGVTSGKAAVYKHQIIALCTFGWFSEVHTCSKGVPEVSLASTHLAAHAAMHTHRTHFLSPPTAHPALLQIHFLFIQGGSTCQRQGREITSATLPPGLQPLELSAAAALGQAGLREISVKSPPMCAQGLCASLLLGEVFLRNAFWPGIMKASRFSALPMGKEIPSGVSGSSGSTGSYRRDHP